MQCLEIKKEHMKFVWETVIMHELFNKIFLPCGSRNRTAKSDDE